MFKTSNGLPVSFLAVVATLLPALTTGYANAATSHIDPPIPLARPTNSIPTPIQRKEKIASSPNPQVISVNDSKLKSGLDALYANDTTTALAIRNTMAPQSLDRHILTWAIAISGNADISSFELISAINTLKHWPGRDIMQRNLERALANENNSTQQILKIFSANTPTTAEGMTALANALLESGQSNKARKLLAPWWHHAKLTIKEEDLVLTTVGRVLLASDHLQRLHTMMLTYQLKSAAHIAALAQAQSLYNGFAAVIRNDRDASTKLAAVDKKWRNDTSFLYAEIVYLRRNGRYEQAANIMLKIPQDTQKLIVPDVWWKERRTLSRELLDVNKPRIAYNLVSQHNGETPSIAADAEFHAGWYALRFLHEPKLALTHFKRIPSLSSRAISSARGYYWMGRSYEALQNIKAAETAFRRAAHFGTTYYGQLAASRLGENSLQIAYPKPTPADRLNFAKLEPVLAINRLEAIGYGKRARLLYLSLGEQIKSPGELALLAVMAERAGDYYTSLKIGKNAAMRGLDVGSLTHPTGAIPQTANISASGKALAYAIARQESEFNQLAISGAGARGILQLMPNTAKAIAKKNGIEFSSERLATDAGYNATLGAHFLGEQLDRFNGSYILTLISYNAGPGRAQQWISRYGDPRGLPIDAVVDWVERIPFSETRNYVMRVMENYEVYKARLIGKTNIKNDLTAGRKSAS